MPQDRFKSYIFQPLITAIFLIVLIALIGRFLGTFSLSFNTGDSSRVFTVEGTGKITKTPSLVSSQYTINEIGTTQKEAQDKGNEKQTKATELLTSLGFNKDDIKTTGYYVNPNYEYAPTQKQNGFMITISTTFKSTDVNKVNKALDGLTAIGVNVGGVSYAMDDKDNEKNLLEARKKAIVDAKNKAEELAKAGGFRVGKLVSISEGDLQNQPLPYAANARELKASAGGAPTDIQPGTSDITATVSITYEIN